MPTSQPTPDLSRLRTRVDQLLEPMATAAIDSQGPLGAAWIRMMMQRQGWDSRALFSRGRLRDVSDATLLRLLIDLADSLDEILVEHGADVEPAPWPRALAEVMAAIGAG